MDHEAQIAHIKDSIAMLVQAQRTTAKAHTQIARVAREAAAAVEDLKVEQSSHAKRLKESEAWQKRMEVTMAEITDKLNGLIGYMDNR
jgi:chromosome segregation ATPase